LFEEYYFLRALAFENLLTGAVRGTVSNITNYLFSWVEKEVGEAAIVYNRLIRRNEVIGKLPNRDNECAFLGTTVGTTILPPDICQNKLHIASFREILHKMQLEGS
jgi:hypothetical protein